MGRCFIIGRAIVFTVNFVLWSAGVLLIVFGAIALADEKLTTDLLGLIDGVEYVAPIVDVQALLEGVAIFMVVLGSLLFLLGWNGCHGIVGKSKKSICVYWILLLAAILVEIALIIYAAVYPSTAESSLREELKNSLDSNFQTVIVSGNGAINWSNDPEEEAWQKLQFESRCCGAYNMSDFNGGPFSYSWNGGNFPNSEIPLECCTISNEDTSLPDSVTEMDFVNCLRTGGPTVTSFNKNGCWETVDDMRWQFSLISIVTSSCLIAFEVLGVIFSMRIWRKTENFA